MEHAKKTFLEKHAAAMVCHRNEYNAAATTYDMEAAFTALADYADELAAKVAELEADVGLEGAIVECAMDGLPGGIAAR